jgi:PIN domain nuclease of toxin-antitoxin system
MNWSPNVAKKLCMTNLAILDASALLALMQNEPGAAIVAARIDNSVISSVNLAETVGKLQHNGIPDHDIVTMIDRLDLDVDAFDAAQAMRTGLLRVPTYPLALSLGDRAAIALAEARSGELLTTDQKLAMHTGDVVITAIRRPTRAIS